MAEQSLDDATGRYRDLIRTTGIFLSHFDLVRHLADAEQRVAAGDDRIDEALFVEIDELVKDFDRSRAEIFSDELERANRIRALLDLPSGSIPRFTVMAYRFADTLSKAFFAFSRKVFPVVGAGMVVALVSNTAGVRSAIDSLIKFIGFP